VLRTSGSAGAIGAAEVAGNFEDAEKIGNFGFSRSCVHLGL
jgi:hypothetical protein